MNVTIASLTLWLTAFSVIIRLLKILYKMPSSLSGVKHPPTRCSMEAYIAGFKRLYITGQLIRFVQPPIVTSNGLLYLQTTSKIHPANNLMYGNRPGKASNIE